VSRRNLGEPSQGIAASEETETLLPTSMQGDNARGLSAHLARARDMSVAQMELPTVAA
jgi:hypothetical protein